MMMILTTPRLLAPSSLIVTVAFVAALSSSFFFEAIHCSEQPKLLLRNSNNDGNNDDHNNKNLNGFDGLVKGEVEEERGMKCKGKVDPMSKRAGKECEGGIKKTASFGIGGDYSGSNTKNANDAVNELATDIASEMHELIHQNNGMIPDRDGGLLFPSDETMSELIELEESIDDNDEDNDDGWIVDYEDGKKKKSKTVSFGGYAKLFWGCNVTYSKVGMKMKKKVACGAKGFQGVGTKHDDYDFIMNDEDNDDDE